MGKGTPTASIVLLIGTSTAGKSTICKRIQELNSELPPSEQMDWQVDGVDLVCDRFGAKLDASFVGLLESDSRFQAIRSQQPHLTETSAAPGNNPPVRKLIEAILSQNLSVDEHELSLADTESYKKSVGDFIAATGGSYSRETLDNLFAIAQERSAEFGGVIDEAHRVWGDHDRSIFKKAVENSKAGKPTILDMVPMDYDLIEKFEACLKEFGGEDFSCPTQIAFVHVDLKELSTRMHVRNENAVASGNPKDIRNSVSPFNQYSRAYTVAADGDRVVGEIKKSDVIAAFGEFGRDEEMGEVALTTLDQAKKMMAGMGIEEAGEDVVKVTTKGSSDAVYQHDSIDATTRIAQRIIDSSTDKSVTPTSPSPTVRIIKGDQLAGDERLRER